MIAPMVAAEDPTISAIVLIAGPFRTGREILEYQASYAVERVPGIPAASRDSAVAAALRSIDERSASQPWLAAFMAYDPVPTARRIRSTPVLILHGETDRQVTADQAEMLARVLRDAGNPDVTVALFPEVNHLMLQDPSGDPTGYTQLDDPRVDRRLLGRLADWTADRLSKS